jgi:hypothetical protein
MAGSARRGAAEYEALTHQLAQLARRGQHPPCTDPGMRHLWTSDHGKDRARAMAMCRGCPLLEPCRAAGRNERWHVWGAVDRSPKPWAQRAELLAS